MSQLNVTSLKHESASGDNITLDSNGNVGIGGSVDNRGGYGRCLQISGTEAAIELESGSDYGYLAQNGTNMQFRNVANGNALFYTNNTERMRIDSAGRVTMPYQVSVRANIDSTGQLSGVSQTTAGTTILPFNNTSAFGCHQVGNSFDTSNHRFTAPVAGKYLVISSVNVIGDNIQYIKVNGSNVVAGEFRSNPNGIWEHNELSVIIHLNVNDYVEAWSTNYGTNKYNGGAGGAPWDMLSIMLIG